MAVAEDEKKKLIVKEIESWRRSKLLPEQYCDFLQNLYLDDLADRPTSWTGAAVQRIGRATHKQWMFTFGIFSLICLVVLHFSAFPVALQIGLIGLGTAGFVVGGAYWRDKLPWRAYLLLGAGMAYQVGGGLEVLQLNGWMDDRGGVALLMICALVWIVCGVAIRFGLLHWCGWLAIIALYAWLLARQVPHPSWVEVQVFWVPAALLFVWISWFMHVKFKSAGAVMFATGLVLWFMPELYSAIHHVDEDWIQIELLVKTVVLGLALYRLRNQWMEWVVQK